MCNVRLLLRTQAQHCRPALGPSNGRRWQIAPHLLPLHTLQIAPHLLPLRPHLPLVIPYLPVLAKHTDRFAPYVAASANADVLVFYFGWMLKVRAAAPPALRATPNVPGTSTLAPGALSRCRATFHTARAWGLCRAHAWLGARGWAGRALMAAAASGAQIPLLNNVLSVPGMPRIAAFLARKLPKRPVRGYTADYLCDYDGCEITTELRPAKASATRGAKAELQSSLQATL